MLSSSTFSLKAAPQNTKSPLVHAFYVFVSLLENFEVLNLSKWLDATTMNLSTLGPLVVILIVSSIFFQMSQLLLYNSGLGLVSISYKSNPSH